MFEITKNINISEYKDIITVIKNSYNFDFSNFSLTSFKRRLEKVYNLYNFKNIEEFIKKLQIDEDFYETFLKDISIPTTEMFRDPQMWIELREKILCKVTPKTEFKIWIPEVTSDDELYSLLIVLDEMHLLYTSKIYVSTFVKQNLEKIKSGVVDIKKMEANSANYTRHNGDFQLSKYFDIEEKRAIFDQVLLSKVEYKHHNLFNSLPFENNFNLIIFRNRMLYYNLQLQNKVLETLYYVLQNNGHLIIGVNETMDGSIMQSKFSSISKTENILKKIR